MGGFIHFDERGPGATIAFAVKFFRGVDAEFTAYSYVWGSVVEDVSRAPAKKTIALGIGIGAEVEEYFTGIVNVHAIINDNDVLGEHHPVSYTHLTLTTTPYV